jgi:hypothetical protein
MAPSARRKPLPRTGDRLDRARSDGGTVLREVLVLLVAELVGQTTLGQLHVVVAEHLVLRDVPLQPAPVRQASGR